MDHARIALAPFADRHDGSSPHVLQRRAIVDDAAQIVFERDLLCLHGEFVWIKDVGWLVSEITCEADSFGDGVTHLDSLACLITIVDEGEGIDVGGRYVERAIGEEAIER